MNNKQDVDKGAHMAQDNCQKIKLLKLIELLRKNTDEEHPLTTMEICGHLGAMGISCERRTLSKDIALLCEQGYEVIWKWVGKEKGYYVENQVISAPELRILTETIEASGSIADSRKAALITLLSELSANENPAVRNVADENRCCNGSMSLAIIEKLFRLCQLPIRVYDKHGRLRHTLPANQQDYSEYEISKREIVLSEIRHKTFSFVLYEEKLPIGICGCSTTEFDFVLGPFAYGKLHDWDARQFMKKKNIIPPSNCKLTDILAIADVVLAAYGEETLNYAALTESSSLLSNEHLDEILAKEELIQYDSFQKNHDYIEEKYAMEYVSRGDIAWIQDHRGNLLPSYPVILDDIKKNEEYMAIIVISLAARAAIQGGLTSQEGFLINDIYLQEVSKCTTVQQIHGVMEQAIVYCANRVAKKKSENIVNLHVEACKKAMATHKRDRIDLDVIAKECGISKGYMQKLFREHEGISVKEYYIKIKMEAAYNLLEFTDRSVGEISEYLGFGSLSYFSDLFKRKTGFTPGQYRYQNQGTIPKTE